MRLKGDHRVYDLPPPTNNMEDPLAVDVEEEDELDLWDMLPYGAIDFRSILLGDFSAIQEKVRLHCLDVLANAGGVIRAALRGVNAISEHCKTLN